MSRIAVIGGGAAGMMAALAAAEEGAEVLLFEKNEKLGKKLYITGKGRCNVTNACDREDFFAHVVSNPRFLYSAYGKWNNWDMMDYLESLGLPLKTERGNRVFPVSDKSSDVIRTLQKALERAGVTCYLNTSVRELWIEREEAESAAAAPEHRPTECDDGRASDAADRPMPAAAKEPSRSETHRKKKKKGRGEHSVIREGTCRGVILADGERISADAVVVATGGVSYPSTGSTGDGYRFAAAAGHAVTDRYPALVPFDAVLGDGSPCRELQGLTLKNVGMQIFDGSHRYAGDFGELLFTHFGVSGPLALTASNLVTAAMNSGEGKSGESSRKSTWRMVIDLKPALTEEQLDRRFLRELEAGANKQMKNLLGAVYPAKLVPVMLRLAMIPPELCGREVTREMRFRLLSLTKSFPVRLLGTRSFQEAIITQGGVSIKEMDPGTMESKKISGLYFAGEVLDLDAWTGGYNLQIAWSTGHSAGTAAAKA